MEHLTSQLNNIGIQHQNVIHRSAESFEDWIQVVRETDANIVATKTLVLKPSKSQTEHLIVIVCRHSTEINIKNIAKSLGYKDARVAQEDLILSVFGVEKINCDSYLINPSTVTIVGDKNIFDGQILAFRDSLPTNSIVLSSETFQKYLKIISIPFQVLDLSNLVVPVSNPKPPKVHKPQQHSLDDSDKEKTLVEKSEKEVIIGLTVTKEDNFPKWYEQVLTRTEMLDYYDVSGCYIIRPYAFAVWKKIQQFFGSEIEELGVEDCYFPMFVTESKLNKEKDHVAGFSPEVAWVTRAGQSDLAEPIAIRPTSETVMYPYYATWIRSHRDLPMRLNQWCNVVRWEFKHPQPFLRTREFLWQEGHTAFATKEEADQEVVDILDLYRRVYEELLAVPVISGKKSEKEKFAGALYTTTVEGFIPATGRAIQGATSHCLGQNFSKMFEIMVDNEMKERSYVWQNSWGLTTRTIGVMVMVHGDNKGLVLPPRVAQIQIIVMPCGLAAKAPQELIDKVYEAAETLTNVLKKGGIRARSDLRKNYTPGYKYNYWEVRGVPVRLEIGPKDIEKNETRAVVRMDGKASQISIEGILASATKLLESIQSRMFLRAKAERDSRLIRLECWDKFVESLNRKCMVLAPWCEMIECEDRVKERSSRMFFLPLNRSDDQDFDEKAPSMGAKTLCIPFDQPSDGVSVDTKCFACNAKAVSYTLWGRSY